MEGGSERTASCYDPQPPVTCTLVNLYPTGAVALIECSWDGPHMRSFLFAVRGSIPNFRWNPGRHHEFLACAKHNLQWNKDDLFPKRRET